MTTQVQAAENEIPVLPGHKDPGGIVTIAQNLADDAADIGQDVSTVDYSVPSGIAVDSSSSDATNGYVTLSGGTHGHTYKVKGTFTFVGGQVRVRSFFLVVADR